MDRTKGGGHGSHMADETSPASPACPDGFALPLGETPSWCARCDAHAPPARTIRGLGWLPRAQCGCGMRVRPRPAPCRHPLSALRRRLPRAETLAGIRCKAAGRGDRLVKGTAVTALRMQRTPASISGNRPGLHDRTPILVCLAGPLRRSRMAGNSGGIMRNRPSCPGCIEPKHPWSLATLGHRV